MRKNLFLSIILALFILNYFYWENAQAASADTFSPSDFQKNANTTIKALETLSKTYLQDKEKEDLNFGLHLVNFAGQVIQDPHDQFITDFSRMSCNNDYEANLPECGSILQELSPYAHLRATNIFNALIYDKKQSNIAKTVARTIIDPFPDNQLNALLSNPNEAKQSDNQKVMANMIAGKAGIMLAQNSFNEIMAKRSPDDSNKNSIIKTIYDESFRRLIDPDWINKTAKLSTENLLLELLQIEAFKLWMDYYKFTQNERIEALLATLVANQIIMSNKNNQQVDASKAETTKKLNEVKGLNSLGN